MFYVAWATGADINSGESDTGTNCGYGGLCSATINGDVVYQAKPERSDNFEIGTKWEFFDSRLLVTAAGFQTDKKDVMEGINGDSYAMLHMGFYLIDIGAMAPAIDEVGIPSIWTGWLALLAMILPAASSYGRAMIKLGRRSWKSIQRLIYLAGILTLAHWLLLDWHWQPALGHAAPVIAAWSALALRRYRDRQSIQGQAADA